MKWLVIVLLGLNLVWFEVARWGGEGAVPAESGEVGEVASLVPGLTLLSEVVPGQHVADQGEPEDSFPAERLVRVDAVPANESSGGRECVVVGPFGDAGAAAVVREQYLSGAVSVSSRTEVVSEVHGYWVFLPAYSSRDAAVAVTQELVARGFTDYFVVRDAEYRNAVSLGLFSSEARARDRQGLLRKWGFPAQVAPRILERQLLWLDAVFDGYDARRMQAIDQRYGVVRTKVRSCVGADESEVGRRR